MKTLSTITVAKGNVGTKYLVKSPASVNFETDVEAATSTQVWSCSYNIRHEADGVVFSSGVGSIVSANDLDNGNKYNVPVMVIPISTEFSPGVDLDIGSYVVGIRLVKKDMVNGSTVVFDQEVARIPLEIVAAV